MMKRCELPDECWEKIFNLLGHHRNLDPLSLVSKNFLSVTNRIRTHFAMNKPAFLSHGTLSPFISRFNYLTSISLVEFVGDLNESLVHIAALDLKIETLDISRNTYFPTDGLALLGKNIKVLICSCVKMLGDPQLAFIADSFPLLEELDISNHGTRHELAMITDTGIEHFASRVSKNLRKIDISGNTKIGDKSILAIFSNCFHLSEITFLECHRVTRSIFPFLVKSTESNLISPLAFSGNQLQRVLSSLHICSGLITDEFLINIANARFPLKKLTLQTYDNGITLTFSGLSILLQTYHSLEYLALDNLVFLDDSLVAVLSAYFGCLIKIKLVGCINLSSSSLFLLIKNCPLLEDIQLEIYIGTRNFITDSVENPRIKSLHLTDSEGLDDECLIILSSICPKLERLDVSACRNIRDRGLERILNKCREIIHLNISYCKKITSIGTGGILKNLKFIEANCVEIANIGLTMIGTRCSELERLSLMMCRSRKTMRDRLSMIKCRGKKTITEDGLYEIITNCKKLKDIHIGCIDVSEETSDFIVPSMDSSSFIYVCYRICP